MFYQINNVQIKNNKIQPYKKLEYFIQKYRQIIFEMQNNIYPIPKDLLSFFIKKCFNSPKGICEKIQWKKLSDYISNSQNISQRFKDDFFNNVNIQSDILLLFVPTNNQIEFKTITKKLFNNSQQKQLFNMIRNQRGGSNYNPPYSIMVIGKQFCQELKDYQEIIEHELVHIFKKIIPNNEQEIKGQFDWNKLSINDKSIFDVAWQSIINNNEQFKTWVINCQNRLQKIFNKYYVIKEKYTIDKFLNELFSCAEYQDFKIFLSFKDNFSLNIAAFLYLVLTYTNKKRQYLIKKLDQHLKEINNYAN